MNSPARIALFSASALVFSVPLILALKGLPNFGAYRGPYGDLVLQGCQEERHSQQAVASVTFDYRGFDTLGEEFILFAAVTGALLLMRPQKTEEPHPPRDHAPGRPVASSSDALRATGVVMFPFAFLLSLYLILHGHLTPGGGFQGGVLAASAFYFVYLTGEYRDLAPFTSVSILDLLEVTGATCFALMAAVPLVRGQAFMLNLLPLGETGKLPSAGTLPFFNASVGLEVGAAFLLLIDAFLTQVIVIGKREDS